MIPPCVVYILGYKITARRVDMRYITVDVLTVYISCACPVGLDYLETGYTFRSVMIAYSVDQCIVGLVTTFFRNDLAVIEIIDEFFFADRFSDTKSGCIVDVAFITDSYQITTFCPTELLAAIYARASDPVITAYSVVAESDQPVLPAFGAVRINDALSVFRLLFKGIRILRLCEYITVIVILKHFGLAENLVVFADKPSENIIGITRNRIPVFRYCRNVTVIIVCIPDIFISLPFGPEPNGRNVFGRMITEFRIINVFSERIGTAVR